MAGLGSADMGDLLFLRVNLDDPDLDEASTLIAAAGDLIEETGARQVVVRIAANSGLTSADRFVVRAIGLQAKIRGKHVRVVA